MSDKHFYVIVKGVSEVAILTDFIGLDGKLYLD
jgi:hypothetical protein